MKKAISLILSLVCMLALGISAGAYDFGNMSYENDHVLAPIEWNGKTLPENSVCILDKSVTIKRAVTVPKTSMLIVEDGVTLTVGRGGHLKIRGFAAVREGAKLNTRYGDLTVYSGGVLNCGGRLAVSKNTTVKVKGEVVVTQSGTAAIKGSVSCGSGVFTIETGAPKYYVPDVDSSAVEAVKVISSPMGDDVIYYRTNAPTDAKLTRNCELVCDGAAVDKVLINAQTLVYERCVHRSEIDEEEIPAGAYVGFDLINREDDVVLKVGSSIILNDGYYYKAFFGGVDESLAL